MIITGDDLLHGDVFLSGRDIIHQTSGGKDLLLNNSWTWFHSNALHVRWSDDNNRALVAELYPDLLPTYDWLPHVVQRVDLVRLLYLHAFGGLYVDMDYEAHSDVLALLAAMNVTNAAVRSPYLLNEVMQNSFMFALEKHDPYWLRVATGITEVTQFIQDGCDHSFSCGFLDLFHIPIIDEFTHLTLTQHMTGSGMLDKTLTRYGNTNMTILEQGFFHGPYATHHHKNTWVTTRLVSASLPVLAILAAVLFCTWALGAGCALTCMSCRSKRVTKINGGKKRA